MLCIALQKFPQVQIRTLALKRHNCLNVWFIHNLSWHWSWDQHYIDKESAFYIHQNIFVYIQMLPSTIIIMHWYHDQHLTHHDENQQEGNPWHVSAPPHPPLSLPRSPLKSPNLCASVVSTIFIMHCVDYNLVMFLNVTTPPQSSY